MRGTIVLVVASLLQEAVTTLEQQPHALAVHEIASLLALANTFRMPSMAAHLVEQLKIAQSTVSG